MDKNAYYREFTRLEKAFKTAAARLLGFTHQGHGEGAQSEAFQLYQIIEELATLADTEKE